MSALRDALRDLSEDVFFDLLESEEAYLLVLDVPGITADSLEVSVENGRLTIDGRREKDLPGEYRYLEENRSLFVGVDLPLPRDALEGETDVAVERGVLEVTIPKREPAETTIAVVERDDGDASDDGETNDDGDASDAGVRSGEREATDGADSRDEPR
ncbi:Hsp20/alpha crystallin family protein [Natrarchaeobius sp. A-rgal3]|uniref:Hsp20/alpha crystallin family protein n=1 Tax=Natrarchaeobius versutus TaxID=1679078 RepID=UPI00350F94C2